MNKRDQILATAERLFNQQGFHATGIDQIVREAGATPRTLYRHFLTKEHLIIEVLQQREKRFLEQIQQHGSGETGLTSLFTELERWFAQEGEKGCLYLRALAEYGHKDTDIADRALNHKQRELESLYTRFGEGTPEDICDKAESLMLIMEGAVARAPVIGGAAAARRAHLLAIRVFESSSTAKTSG